MKEITIFIIGYPDFRKALFRLFSTIDQIKIIGGADGANYQTTQSIIQQQPAVVIHHVDGCAEDYQLISKVLKKLTGTYYVVIGDTSQITFRIRCNSLGVNHILPELKDLNHVFGILQPLLLPQA